MDSEMGLSGKTVLVVGTGISGIAAVNLCQYYFIRRQYRAVTGDSGGEVFRGYSL